MLKFDNLIKNPCSDGKITQKGKKMNGLGREN